jgi:YggT family protein
MFIIGNFITALATVISMVLTLYMYVIIARAVLSWVSPDPYNPIVRFINNITDPVLNWIRMKLPANFGGIDISPMIVILAIIFLQQFLVTSLTSLARSLI